MVEFLIKEDLKEYLEEFGLAKFKNIVNDAYKVALRTGFNIPNQFILGLSYPNRMVAYKDDLGNPNILFDPVSFSVSKEEDNSLILQNTAHEMCHLAVARTGFLEFCNYRLLKGSLVKEYSNQEFRNKITNLIDNVRVDSRLCAIESSLYGAFSKNHGDSNFIQSIEALHLAKQKRRKYSIFPYNYDNFNRIIEILHPAVVSRHLKDKGFLSGKLKTIATCFDRGYHQYLKGAVGSKDGSLLDEVYNELRDLAVEDYCNENKVSGVLKSFWERMKELN